MNDANFDISENKMACQIMEIQYKDALSKGGETYQNLFPTDWFDYADYEKKITILMESIEKNIKIIETDLYQDMIEGVKQK